MRFRPGQFVFLLVLLSAGLAFSEIADVIQEKEEELREIREKLTQSREKAKQLEDKEASILEKVQGLDVQLELNQELVDELKAKEDRKSSEISDVESKIEVTGEKLKFRQAILSNRLRAIYRQGSLHTMEVILSAGSFADMVTRTKYMTLIAEQDARLKNQIEKNKQELTDYGEKLARDLSELRSTREESETELENLDRDKKKRETLLEDTRKEKKSQEKLAEELARSEVELQLLIDELIRRRAEEARREDRFIFSGEDVFSKYKGKLRWPVDGKVVSGFGTKKHPKYGTSTLNNGIDIEAPKGMRVFAVAGGQVAYADRFLGYGQVIILDHGVGYYSLYAHLSTILVNVGDLVAQRDIIAQVGDSGSLEGPRLHFEIREQGRPTDPSAWLE